MTVITTNPITAMGNVLTKPNPVFHTLASVNNWSWLPFILLNAATMLSVYVYFQFVDFNWYIDTMVQATAGDISPAEMDIQRESMAQVLKPAIQIFSIPFGAALGNAILAIYLHLMTKNNEANVQGFTDWYGATWWVQMPAVVAALFAVIVIAVVGGEHLSPNYLSPFSLAFLVGAELGSDAHSILSMLRLETFWSIYLLTACISKWTSFSARKALIIATAPYLIIFIGTCLFNLFN